MFKAKGIYKAYRKRAILRGIDFEAEPGSCVGIVGSNGCGKTTFLSILAGALKADKGSLEADGVDLFANRKRFYEKVAYVPQENPLIPELTVRDNLSLWHRGSRAGMLKDLEEGPAAMLGLQSMEKMTVSHLSGGMKKRLSLACALSGHAPYLVMDEPGAALDLECKEAIRQYLKRYMADGGAVVLTSHELDELSLCSRVYVLRDGVLHLVEGRQTIRSLIAQFHGKSQ